ncbi:glycosyltransferase [Conexibacter sp. SYSU D00693]|uniref:UDP-N-acetylglucosamine--N-acetylmuramyl- (pentapeptide) pyrophosphoryl-undecaprenol N-acetylglucosamine transferase n=1 Tax=Conexibacter sp. SYSU D00693 TaxID=2812560 RepID=UPI001F11F223|nr:UDP-N-acetylglucosamine--N-acetylmuramyl-(pentapeptide) pyrophosphoryl-undecaprenol N-acetylglucosamine transferase [Conexibacter sp. SYSU D00693]
MPALAVADALRAEADVRVVFVGGERAEAQLVPEAGYELRRVRVEGISRSNPLKAARAVLRAGGAVAACSRLLGELRPAAVMGGGGYVAGVAGAAAVRRRVPLVLTEADSHLGVSNRLLARWARRVCLAFPIAGLEGERFRVLGRPVPAPQTDVGAARARFGLAADDTCVLVFGGSLGARSINEAAVEGLAGADFKVLHACGRRDFALLRSRLGDPPPAGYDLRDYIAPFGDALAACDLVVARAGGSIFEVAAHAKPAVLVPYPHATADHQTANARWMVDAGAAVLVPDAELDAARLRTEVEALLADPARLLAMGAASGALARPYAARDIAREVLRAAGLR